MSNSSSPRDRLLKTICERSYREGDFTLSSGAKSSFYIDLKPTLLHPAGASAFGDLVCEWIASDHLKFDAVGGLTLGADPMVMAVSLAAHTRGLEIPAVMIRKEPKKHGTSRFIEGVENLRPGARVLVLEDVVTTGLSSRECIEGINEEGGITVGAACLIDRSGGKADVGVPLAALTAWQPGERPEFR